jgi:hypothetical protein
MATTVVAVEVVQGQRLFDETANRIDERAAEVRRGLRPDIRCGAAIEPNVTIGGFPATQDCAPRLTTSTRSKRKRSWKSTADSRF